MAAQQTQSQTAAASARCASWPTARSRECELLSRLLLLKVLVMSYWLIAYGVPASWMAGSMGGCEDAAQHCGAAISSSRSCMHTSSWLWQTPEPAVACRLLLLLCCCTWGR